MDSSLKDLQDSYQSVLDALVDFFSKRQMTEFGFKINEFSVFASFLATSAFLRKNNSGAAVPALEEFHKAIIVSIVDRIVADSHPGLERKQIDELTPSIRKIMMDRYGEYSQTLRAEAGRSANIGKFSLLVDAFLGHGLAQPLDQHQGAGLELGRCLQRVMKGFL